jgi:hypothetical protein
MASRRAPAAGDAATRVRDSSLMQRTRKTLLAVLLVAVTVALGAALAGVPNVELMTITVFISGFLLGHRLGAFVGGAAMALHSVFNPLGAALPPLLAAQIMAFAVVGATGALVGPALSGVRRRYVAMPAAGVVGLVLTLFYQVLSNTGAFLAITGENAPSNLFKFIAAGIAFTAMHLVWNTALFFVAAIPAMRVLTRYREELIH